MLKGQAAIRKQESTPKRILVLDDDPGVRRLMSIILERAGYAVESAGCTAEAMQFLSCGRFDALVTDHEMPVENGLSFVRRMRSGRDMRLASHRDIPVIVVSGSLGRSSLKRLDGVSALVEKPFKPASFAEVIHRVLSGDVHELIHLHSLN